MHDTHTAKHHLRTSSLRCTAFVWIYANTHMSKIPCRELYYIHTNMMQTITDRINIYQKPVEIYQLTHVRIAYQRNRMIHTCSTCCCACIVTCAQSSALHRVDCVCYIASILSSNSLRVRVRRCAKMEKRLLNKLQCRHTKASETEASVMLPDPLRINASCLSIATLKSF